MTAPMQGGGGHEITAAKERIEELRREVQKIYIGSARALDMMMVSLLARGHVLLEGVPGVAKTTLVKAFATALGCSARRIQFTPDLLPADITGTYVLSPKYGTFSLRAGPIFANVVLADEINRAPARATWNVGRVGCRRTVNGLPRPPGGRRAPVGGARDGKSARPPRRRATLPDSCTPSPPTRSPPPRSASMS